MHRTKTLMDRASSTSLVVGVLAFLGACGWSQWSSRPRAQTAGTPSGIQWFATWESGRREAERLRKPILLVAAAPHCAGVSGIW